MVVDDNELKLGVALTQNALKRLLEPDDPISGAAGDADEWQVGHINSLGGYCYDERFSQMMK